MKRQYNPHQVAWLVGNMHVMTRDYVIVRDIAKRTKDWPREQRKMAIKDAIAAHHGNLDLYVDVMTGRIGGSQ